MSGESDESAVDLTASTGESQVGDDPGAHASEDVQVFAFVEDDARQVVPIIDRFYLVGSDHFSVASVFRRLSDQAPFEGNEPLRSLVSCSLSYSLILGSRGNPGCSLGPLSDWPPQISEASDEIVKFWQFIASETTSPMAKARFYDLLSVARSKGAYLAAKQAIFGYVECFKATQDLSLDITELIMRAWDLAKKFKIRDQLDKITEEMLDRVACEMVRTSETPGCVIPLLEALAKDAKASFQGRSSKIKAVENVLEQAFRAYPRSDIATTIATLMRSVAETEEDKVAISRREVAAYKAEADATTGLVRQHHLVEAIRIAQKRKLHDEVASLTVDLQSMSIDDLEFQTFESSVEVPVDLTESHLKSFTRGSDWRQAFLLSFLHSECPVGELGEIKREIERSKSEFVLAQLFNSVQITADGMPKWSSGEGGSRDDQQLETYTRIHAEINGRFLVLGLMRFRERYGPVDSADFVSFLLAEGCGAATQAQVLARAFEHYWSGDYLSCVHLIVPKIEALARSLLREMNEPVYKLQVANDPGGYSTLYALLGSLVEAGLDESWAHFLKWLLIGPTGPNLRNEIAHGLTDSAGPVYAILALMAASVLIMVSPDPKQSRERAEIAQLLARPVVEPVAFPALSPRSNIFLKRVLVQFCASVGRRLTSFAAKHWG